MTHYDVHTDKALKELRARLDQAERERDEARAALGKIAAAARRVVAAEVAYECANDDAEMASRREPLPDELARRIDMTAEELLSAEREFRTELEAVL